MNKEQYRIKALRNSLADRFRTNKLTRPFPKRKARVAKHFNWGKNSAAWEFLNKPLVILVLTGVIFQLTGYFFLEHQAKIRLETAQQEKMGKLDIQISHTVATIRREIQIATEFNQLAIALSKIQNPDVLFPEFKDIPLDGLLLEALSISKDAQEKIYIVNSYDALQFMRLARDIYIKRSNETAISTDIRGAKKEMMQRFEFNFNVRRWKINMPIYNRSAS